MPDERLTKLEALGQGIWRYVQPLTRTLLPLSNPIQAVALGSLWGLLPCGLIYSTLTWVGANADPILGLLTMTCFGVGTLPGIFMAGFLAKGLGSWLQSTLFRGITGIALVLYGAWTLYSPIIKWLD